MKTRLCNLPRSVRRYIGISQQRFMAVLICLIFAGHEAVQAQVAGEQKKDANILEEAKGEEKPTSDSSNSNQPSASKPVTNSAPSNPSTSSTAAKPVGDPEIIKLFLMDGSVIAGRLSMKEIAVETQFGNLNVPVTSIKSITPGLTSHPSLAKDVTRFIADLGSSNYNDREKAQQALAKMGLPVRAELERQQNDTDVERRNRIKALLAEFDQLAEDQDSSENRPELGPAMQQRDMIETTEFTIVGKIVPQSFSVGSPYGELSVKLADIRRGHRDVGRKEDARQNFSVDGTNLASRSLLNTNLRIERGDIVTVTADGTLTMTPWGNGSISTPDGGQNFGWFLPNQIASGTLVGKVGTDQFIKLGSKSTFTAERSGTLQLGIGMQQDYQENQFPGKYNVKIRVQRKQK